MMNKKSNIPFSTIAIVGIVILITIFYKKFIENRKKRKKKKKNLEGIIPPNIQSVGRYKRAIDNKINSKTIKKIGDGKSVSDMESDEFNSLIEELN